MQIKSADPKKVRVETLTLPDTDLTVRSGGGGAVINDGHLKYYFDLDGYLVGWGFASSDKIASTAVSEIEAARVTTTYTLP